MDKNSIMEQIKRIDEEIGRAIDAISEIEDIVKASQDIDDAIEQDTTSNIRDKFNLLTQKLDEVTKAIIRTGIISDIDIDGEIESRH